MRNIIIGYKFTHCHGYSSVERIINKNGHNSETYNLNLVANLIIMT